MDRSPSPNPPMHPQPPPRSLTAAPPIPPARRSVVLVPAAAGGASPAMGALPANAHPNARRPPSPPPKPSALSSPGPPPRKPAVITTAGAGVPPPPPLAPLPRQTTGPHAMHYQHQHHVSAPPSIASSPAAVHSATFAHSATVHTSSPSPVHPRPLSFLRPSASTSFPPSTPSLLSSSSDSMDDPFADSNHIQQDYKTSQRQQEQQQQHTTHAPPPPPHRSTSPSFAPRPQSSLLSARLLSSSSASPSPASPAPIAAASPAANATPLSNSVSPSFNLSTSIPNSPGFIRAAAASFDGAAQPSIPPPPRSRSPLIGQHPAQPVSIGSTTRSQRHVSMQPFSSPATSLSSASPGIPTPPPPRRASVQFTSPHSTQHSQHQHPPPPPPRGSSPLFGASGEAPAPGLGIKQDQSQSPGVGVPLAGMSSGTGGTRFRNVSSPSSHLHDPGVGLTPQTPKRVFSINASTGVAPSSAAGHPISPPSYGAPGTLPVPTRSMSTMDLSDALSDSDSTESADSDLESADSDALDEDTSVQPPPLPTRGNHNPFATSAVESSPIPAPRPIRARTFMPDTPPSLPSRSTPTLKPPQPLVTHLQSSQTMAATADADVAPALPPKPSIRRKPRTPQDHAAVQEQEPQDFSNHHARTTAPVAAGPSTADGVFPDYSRSNRRLPLFADVHGIQDIQQKSHGVRAFSISNEQVATATSNIRVFSVFTGDNISSYGHEKDVKPTSVLFTQSRRPSDMGHYLWVGSSDGSLQVIDTRSKEVVEKKKTAHKGFVILNILRSKTHVWTLDESGTVNVWPEDGLLGRPTLGSPQLSLMTTPKPVCAVAVLDQLWTSDGAKIFVHHIPLDGGRPKFTPVSMELPFGIGALTCIATIAGSGQVFSGHEDGKVVVWSIELREMVRVINVHAYRIMSLLGVGSYLWAGFATGKIYVLDLRPETPLVIKDWQAHKESGVQSLQLDEEGLILSGRHQVGSCAENGEIRIWDGLMSKDRLTKGMVDRSKEYCHYRDLKILICSWNIDASKPAAQQKNGGADARLFDQWLTGMDNEGHGPPDIISVGFQEIVDLESKKMTAKSLLKGSKKAETETISKQYRRWQVHITNRIRELYASQGVQYKLLECSNLVGLFSCVFVRLEEWENVRSDWTHVDMVKTGLKGYHGNKGGIATRLIIDDSSISFVNCHLAAGQSHTWQRNTDAANILKKLNHPNPVMSNEIIHPEVFWFGDGTLAMDHEICFLSGDLNYRIDLKYKDTIEQVSKQNWALLQANDQLLQQRVRNPQFALRAFQEAELLFAPTYKYDPDTDVYDTSAKHRTPAWCDRILWRGRHIRQLFYRRCEVRVSDHRPISGGFIVSVKRIDEAQRRVIEKQVREGWLKVQEKEIRIKKLAWLRSWGWTEHGVEQILDREGGDLSRVVQILGGTP
ncbi:hypothetical protein BGZ73_006993 [Actinomortierella ambigua]|nr:hypothetical protein BGZ73_006993 [Actinomortierella ambigua]